MPRASRAVSVLVKVVGGVLALLALAYLGFNGASLVQAKLKRDEVADRVTAELERALPAAADRQQDVVAAATREPDERWIEQHCEFSTDDAGWIVQGYREVCTVRGVTAWQVESPREARELLAIEGQAGLAHDGCEPLGVVDEAEVTFVDAATAEGEPWCTRTLSAPGTTRSLMGDRGTLEPGRWLLVVDEQPLVDEPIGCVHWSVIFCDNPFGDDHAFGEAPTSGLVTRGSRTA